MNNRTEDPALIAATRFDLWTPSPATEDVARVKVTPPEVLPTPLSGASVMSKTQNLLLLLTGVGFIHLAKPVMLPIVLACVAGMALKPLIRWLTCCRIHPAIVAAV